MSGEGRIRTADTTIFSRVLYQLSYLASGRNRIGGALGGSGGLGCGGEQAFSSGAVGYVAAVGMEPEPITLAQAVRRAVEACEDSTVGHEGLGRLLERFEDADEPITAVQDLELRLADGNEEADPELEDPAVSVAIATVLYLAYRRDMIDAEDEDLLRLAARAEWSGNPPEAVDAWLAARGVEA